jgi:hypothetical protein
MILSIPDLISFGSRFSFGGFIFDILSNFWIINLIKATLYHVK